MQHQQSVSTKACQTNSKVQHVGVQTFTQLKEMGVQCMLHASAEYDEEEMEVDPAANDHCDPDWVPGEHHVEVEDDVSDDDDEIIL